jgi:TolB protein
MRLSLLPALAASLLLCSSAVAQAPAPAAAATPGAPAPNENDLGPFIVTGLQQQRLPKIAVLPSLSPDLEDVIVRGVVRRDFELTGMYDVIADDKAPAGMYGFTDPVDVDAWRKLGAEAIVKVAARALGKDQIEVFGLAYFLNVGKDPVYEKKLVVKKSDARITAHRITDALLGALTGRPGGFASQFTFSGKWGRNRRIFRMDSDGNGLAPLTDQADTAIAPVWAANGAIIYLLSKNYSPFALMSLSQGTSQPMKVPFTTSILAAAMNKDFSKLALAVTGNAKSAIYVGNPDGSAMNKVSQSELATKPVFSPSGKLAWVGGDQKQGGQRIFIDGKAVSPSGFSASAPTFCDTEDGIRLVYSVAVGNNSQDIVMADERGQMMGRLTQGQGSNTYPACSLDGRLLAFFSTRNKSPGIYMMSLKSFRTQQISTQVGESLSWAAIPGPTK